MNGVELDAHRADAVHLPACDPLQARQRRAVSQKRCEDGNGQTQAGACTGWAIEGLGGNRLALERPRLNARSCGTGGSGEPIGRSQALEHGDFKQQRIGRVNAHGEPKQADAARRERIRGDGCRDLAPNPGLEPALVRPINRLIAAVDMPAAGEWRLAFRYMWQGRVNGCFTSLGLEFNRIPDW